MEITPELIEDVAAELGINNPSLVEKDYHAVQALALLTGFLKINSYPLLVHHGGDAKLSTH